MMMMIIIICFLYFSLFFFLSGTFSKFFFVSKMTLLLLSFFNFSRVVFLSEFIPIRLFPDFLIDSFRNKFLLNVDYDAAIVMTGIVSGFRFPNFQILTFQGFFPFGVRFCFSFFSCGFVGCSPSLLPRLIFQHFPFSRKFPFPLIVLRWGVFC